MKKSNEQSLGDAIRSFLKQHELTGKLAEAEVVAAWSKVLGPAIDRRTVSIRLDKTGRIYVELTSASLRNELSMQRTRLAEALNETIGREIVKDIILV
ncbi:DUF721 domain-containing protein [Phaeocystidibacter marisrubri]|uniref:DUF721 domain-containing protein n=1 Tax=Phaeocystidibacter marisrubri TaxID=1577780 RepID=UPI001478EDBC|nr:DUF721 domain-containing protein [Phaeocystidibacter marisrubri]GGH74923.1 hypothetical protein GCM10011318_21410 [Phaeocystidibacter marisrubri]